MNIVKFRDIIITPGETGLSQEICDLFNGKFKGRYCWNVRWTCCVSFDDMTLAQYLDGEIYGLDSWEGDNIMFDVVRDFVDVDATEKVNSIDKYVFFNGYAMPDDITIDMLRRFRTWLAESLHIDFKSFVDEFFGDEASKVHNMLNYYCEEMNDSTVQMLQSFITTSLTYTTYNTTGASSCGCTGGTNSLSLRIPTTQTVKLYPNMSGLSPVTLGKDCGCQQGFTIGGNYSINNCDPVAIYKNAMYGYMIQVFSNVDFWISLSHYDPSGDKNFIKLFKRYVDGIILQNFPLVGTTAMEFDDCQCLNSNDKEQERLMNMLRELSTALGYIIEDSSEETYEYAAGELVVKNQLSGHSNYVKVALTNWATYLYEIMRW